MKFMGIWSDDERRQMEKPPSGFSLPSLKCPVWREYLLLSLALAVVFIYCNKPVQDPDTFWHLAAGRSIWHSGHLLTKETFSYTAPGAPWVDEEWLFHVIAWPIERLGGFDLLRFLTALAGVLTAGLLYRCVRLLGGNATGFVIFFLPLLGVYAERFRFRPELFSLVFMAILLEGLLRWSTAPNGWVKRLPWLLPLFLVWVQMHGAWAYGFFLLFAFLVGGIADAAAGDASIRRLTGHAAATLAATLTVLFINPFGWRLPLFPIHHFLSILGGARYVPIAEWMRTPFSGDYRLFYLLVLIAFCLLFVLRGRFRWKDFAIVSSQSLLGFYWVRYVAYALLSLIPASLSRFPHSRIPRWLKGTGIAAAFAGTLFAGFHGIARPPARPSLAERYPVTEAAFLKENDIRGNIFHAFRVGGYLEWTLAPDCKIFMDGRFGPFNRLGMEYYEAHRTIKAFKALLKRYPPDIVIYAYPDYRFQVSRTTPPRGPSVILYPQSEWAFVYCGDYGMVLLRREPRFAEAIHRFGYSILRPDDLPFLVRSAKAGGVSKSVFEEEVSRALKDSPPPGIRLQLGRALHQPVLSGESGSSEKERAW